MLSLKLTKVDIWVTNGSKVCSTDLVLISKFLGSKIGAGVGMIG
jgi:hypothetical protein